MDIYESFEIIVSKDRWLIVGKLNGLNIKRVIAECPDDLVASAILETIQNKFAI